LPVELNFVRGFSQCQRQWHRDVCDERRSENKRVEMSVQQHDKAIGR